MNKFLLNPFKEIRDYAHNPLGIVAMFISLIYGFAVLLLATSVDKFTASERTPLIWFIIVFPCLILIVFYRLVTKHHEKLYSPSDFRDDSSFLQTISTTERQLKYREEAEEVLRDELPTQTDVDRVTAKLVSPQTATNQVEDISKQIRAIEDKVISKLEHELNVTAIRNVKYGPAQTGLIADAVFLTKPVATFFELKFVRYPTPFLVDDIRYTAAKFQSIAQHNVKLIFVIVYSSDKAISPKLENDLSELSRATKMKIVIRTISLEQVDGTEKILRQ